MNSSLFKVNAKDVLSAVLSGVVIAILGYLSTLTNILNLDTSALLNVAVLAIVTSLLKALGTNSDGKFGGLQIK